MAEQLIASLSSEFEPTKFHDEYRERVLDLIERKAAGEEIAVQPEAEEPAAAPDLMAALEASLAAVKDEQKPAPSRRQRSGSRSGGGTRSGSSGRKQPARSGR
jgi:DNA end-binding protein Ku